MSEQICLDGETYMRVVDAIKRAINTLFLINSLLHNVQIEGAISELQNVLEELEQQNNE